MSATDKLQISENNNWQLEKGQHRPFINPKNAEIFLYRQRD